MVRAHVQHCVRQHSVTAVTVTAAMNAAIVPRTTACTACTAAAAIALAAIAQRPRACALLQRREERREHNQDANGQSHPTATATAAAAATAAVAAAAAAAARCEQRDEQHLFVEQARRWTAGAEREGRRHVHTTRASARAQGAVRAAAAQRPAALSLIHI